MKTIPYWTDNTPKPAGLTVGELPSERFDAVIIGAGVTGLTAARRLADLGKNMLVVDALEIGSAASAVNGGQLNYGLKPGLASLEKQYGTETTANAGLIMPRPWNLVLEPGDHSKAELFSEVKRGIYITNVWYTRFQNYVTGDFSTIPRDGIFLVENGNLRPIRNIRVSDNLGRILRNVVALGNESFQVHWWEVSRPVITPYVLVKDVGITRATK